MCAPILKLHGSVLSMMHHQKYLLRVPSFPSVESMEAPHFQLQESWTLLGRENRKLRLLLPLESVKEVHSLPNLEMDQNLVLTEERVEVKERNEILVCLPLLPHIDYYQ